MARAKDSVEKAVQRLPAGSKLLLAVSGGVDSVVLLHAVSAAAGRRKLTLEVAHIDHRVRPASAADARFVRAAAKERGLQFHMKRLPRCPRGQNFEAWARDQRYKFFTGVRARRKLDWILTAHSANDVAETLLMRLVANRELRSIAAADERRCVMRPFLGVLRSDIERYAKAHRLLWREDESNTDPRFLRNRVRRVLIPLLERDFDRAAVRSLSERAAALEEQAEMIDELCSPALARVARAGGWGRPLWLRRVRRELDVMPHSLRSVLIDRLFREKLGFSVGRRAALRIGVFLEGNGAALELSGGVSLRRRGGGLALQHAKLPR